MRVVALLATYNEERFAGACIEHLGRNGIETYLIDNESTDATVEIAERLDLAGLETAPRHGLYAWRPLLERKEALAETLDADWFIHLDADEIRLPPRSSITLAEAISEIDALGYNAVNFQEFTFVPTVEAPDHDHPRFQETMRHYYPFRRAFPDQLNAWKRQDERVCLATSGGHRIDFPGLRMYPNPFPMRHYLYLSVDHAVEKSVERAYDSTEIEIGWHRRRAVLDAGDVTLLSQSELRELRHDGELDASDPWSMHPLFAASA
jgi:hypothetical protein